MNKRIRAKLYMESKIIWKPLRAVSDPHGYLYSDGRYPTKILPADMPEWFVCGYLYKRHGYISSKGVKHLLYVPNYTFDNHLHKDDILFISYDAIIEPYETESRHPWYKGYDYLISGSLILNFVEAAEKHSKYDVSGIRREIEQKQAWYHERNPKD